MSIFNDKTIWENRRELFKLCVEDIERDQIQPCSVDLKLDKTLKTIKGESIDISKKPYLLQPHEFILGSTKEYVKIPRDIVGRVEGRSSVGRLGLMVHVTAGFIDPGFNGNITLELYNVSDQPFKLKYNDRLCQIVFETLDRPTGHPYNGKYQFDEGVVTSKGVGYVDSL